MRYAVGIDVAKQRHQMVILDEQGAALGPAQAIANNSSGFEACLARLRALNGPVQVALEATGPYWLALYEQLTAAGFAVQVFNPLQIHAYRQTGLRRTQTDRGDAFWIADFLRIGGEATSSPPDKRAYSCRS